MNPTQKINFRQTRDVGQVYNTAFRFMRQNRRVLFKSITYYIMPFILVSGFLLFNSFSEFIVIGKKGVDGNWLPIGLAVLQFIVGGIMCYVAYTAYITLIYEYMRLYHLAEDPDTITHKDVWKATKSRFFMGLLNVFVWGILVSVLSSIAVGVLYFLGIIGVLLSLVFSSPWIIFAFYFIGYIAYMGLLFYLQSLSFPMVFISAFERVDVFSAFGKSFTIVNRKVSIWNALGSSFLGAALMRILYANMVSLPVAIIVGILIYYDIDPTQSFNTENIWFIIVFKVVLPICTVIYFYTLCIYFITQSFEVLNLSERFYGMGMMEKINKLGTRKDIGPEYYDISY